MTGKEAIIEKILADARAIANSTLEEAGKRGSEIIGVAQRDAEIYREKNMKESYAEREETVRRRITAANLEVKKTLLAAKQALISEAFDKAVEDIRADKKTYLKLLDGMLDCAADGDTVTFSESDKDIISKKWLDGKAADRNIKLNFGGFGNFRGGMIISDGGSDKNLSLEVEIKSVREIYEPQIADILFNSGTESK